MKDTENTMRLAALLSEREKLALEITRIEDLGRSVAGETETILANPNALDDEAAGRQLAKLQSKTALIPAKINLLGAQLSTLDAEIGELATTTLRELWAAIEGLRKSRYEKFCNAIAPFFAQGLAARFFNQNPHSSSPDVAAKHFFTMTIAKRSLDSLTMSLGKADPAFSIAEPAARAGVVLSVIPTIPLH